MIPPRVARLLILGAALATFGRALADPPLPKHLLDPQSAVQAWNTIRIATQNVARLIEEKRLDEIPVQISFCSPSLRALERYPRSPDDIKVVHDLSAQALASVINIARFSQQKSEAGTADSFVLLKKQLEELGSHFDPKLVAADVYFCPMHPEAFSEQKDQACPNCAMTMVPRRIPYSFVYTRPGESSIRLTAETDGPIVAGKKTTVKVRLARPGRPGPVSSPPLPSWMCGGGVGPLGPNDLMEMHTQKVHLLIEEPGLGDYHHEHPVPTGVPGEYVFSFTPAKSVPYRVWADLVPMATGIQELPRTDLPSEGRPATATAHQPSTVSVVEGYTFTLSLSNGSSTPVAGQTNRLAINVTGPDGKPVTALEPVMNAFAHLVGFYDDYETVVHIHPTGGDVLNPAFRGGPALGFQFFPPKAGFVRLYCQVSIGGRMLFASFGVQVVPKA